MADIFHNIEHAGAVVVKDIAVPFVWTAKASKVLATVIKNQPALKADLITLVTKAEKIAADGAVAAGSKGVDLVADAAVLADAEAFFEWVKEVIVPLIETLYGQIKHDVQDPVAPVAPAPSV